MSLIFFEALKGPGISSKVPGIRPSLMRIHYLKPTMDFMGTYGPVNLSLRLLKENGQALDVGKHLGQKTWDYLVDREVISPSYNLLNVAKLRDLVSQPDFLVQTDLKLRNPREAEDKDLIAEIICARIADGELCLVNDKYGWFQDTVIDAANEWFNNGDFTLWNRLRKNKPDLQIDLSGLNFSWVSGRPDIAFFKYRLVKSLTLSGITTLLGFVLGAVGGYLFSPEAVGKGSALGGMAVFAYIMIDLEKRHNFLFRRGTTPDLRNVNLAGANLSVSDPESESLIGLARAPMNRNTDLTGAIIPRELAPAIVKKAGRISGIQWVER